MKRIVALVLVAALTVGVGTLVASKSYGFLWFGKDKKFQKTTLTVQGMSCDGCASTVAAALQKVEGVKCAKVDLGAGTAEVCFDKKKTNVDALGAAVVQAGYTFSGSQMGECVHGTGACDAKGASMTEGASCIGMKSASASEGASCCASGAKKTSTQAAGSTCPFSGAAKQASAEGAACAHGAGGEHAAGCPHRTDVKEISTGGAVGGCPHANGTATEAKGQKS